ncbi:DUF6342 family protein [Microbispora sp. CA-102843]|uniref:DUF6342 family protein n=1 Tax=Microbispora sp. CA-102843 TaxID=3239952 RepID=UPI003D8BEC44
MPDIDLGQASNWDEGDFHGRIKLANNHFWNVPEQKDVVIGSPNSVEISVNTNFSSSQEMDKIYFTTHHGSTKKIIGVLDSDGNLYIAGQVITGQKNLSY